MAVKKSVAVKPLIGLVGLPDEQTLLEVSYSGLTTSEPTGEERVIIYGSVEELKKGVEKNPYAHHILQVEEKGSLTVDDGLALASSGVSRVVQKDSPGALMEAISQCLAEKKNISFYLSTEPSLRPDIKVDMQTGRLHLEGYKNNHLVGQSAALSRLLSTLQTIKIYDGYDVLVLGENGTGKELVTRTILENSARSQKSVVLNVASMSDELFKSELMGYRKGAFTGADRDTEGYLKRFDGGLVVFDEIGDLSLQNQATLLRVIQERQAVRLGPGESPYQFDIQFVFATNRPLESMVEKGTFRLDLFNRLKKQIVMLPTLRERKEDIPLLAHYFINEVNKKVPSRPRELSGDALEVLSELPWPGNVRELEQLLFRSHMQAQKKEITGTDIIALIRGEKYSPSQVVKHNHEVAEQLEKKYKMQTI